MYCEGCNKDLPKKNFKRHQLSCLNRKAKKEIKTIRNENVTAMFNSMVEMLKEKTLFHVMVLEEGLEEMKKIIVPVVDAECECNHSGKKHHHYIGTFEKSAATLSRHATKAGIINNTYRTKKLDNIQYLMTALGYIQTKVLKRGTHEHHNHVNPYIFQTKWERNQWFIEITKTNIEIWTRYQKYLDSLKEKQEKKTARFEYYLNNIAM